MKKGIIILGLFLFIFSAAHSQNDNSRATRNQHIKNQLWPTDFTKSVDILVGVVPNPNYNALKFDVGVSNVLFKVVGFYTSFEVGMDSDYFSNILGLNISIMTPVYFYAGADFLTSYGVIEQQNENPQHGVRKELGIGAFPVKNLTLRMGYSTDVGLTFTAGYRIPFKKHKNYQTEGIN